MSLNSKKNFFFFFWWNKHGKGSNTKLHHNSTQKLPQLYPKVIVTFKGGCGKLYYTQHTLLSNVGQLPILFFEKQTHTQERGKGARPSGVEGVK